MKFCTHCGLQLDNEANFCPKCGTRSVWNETNEQPAAHHEQQSPAACVEPVIPATDSVPCTTQAIPEPDPAPCVEPAISEKPQMHKGMKIAALISVSLAALYASCAFDTDTLDMLALPVILLHIAFIFVVLGYSPKEDPFVHWRGKPTRIKKPVFVLLMVFIAYFTGCVFVLFVNRLYPLLCRIF